MYCPIHALGTMVFPVNSREVEITFYYNVIILATACDLTTFAALLPANYCGACNAVPLK